LTNVGNIRNQTLDMECIINAENIDNVKDIILTLCKPFFALEYGDEVLLIETPRRTFYMNRMGFASEILMIGIARGLRRYCSMRKVGE